MCVCLCVYNSAKEGYVQVVSTTSGEEPDYENVPNVSFCLLQDNIHLELENLWCRKKEGNGGSEQRKKVKSEQESLYEMI